MNLVFRILYVFFANLFKKKVKPTDPVEQTFRVLPNDLDINFHMNNGRFLTVMDLGRMQMIMRSGLMPTLWRHNWQLILGGSSIFYRRGLNPFQKYTLKTELVYWDDKWVYLKQSFVVGKRLHAVGLVRGIFKKKKETVSPRAILEKLNCDPESPPLPDEVKHLRQSLDELYAHAKRA